MLECPVCNGFTILHERCAVCSSLLSDTGKVDDLLGPYAPYMETSSSSTCTHLLRCDNCYTDTRWPVPVMV